MYIFRFKNCNKREANSAVCNTGIVCGVHDTEYSKGGGWISRNSIPALRKARIFDQTGAGRDHNRWSPRDDIGLYASFPTKCP